jgi:hypothetical protein
VKSSWISIYKFDDEYVVQTKGDFEGVAGTLELALIDVIQQAGIEGVELAPTLEAAEVLESLLGTDR